MVLKIMRHTHVFSDTCFQNHIAYNLWSCCDNAMIYDMPWLDMIMLCFMLCLICHATLWWCYDMPWLDMIMLCIMLCFKRWYAMTSYDFVMLHDMLKEYDMLCHD